MQGTASTSAVQYLAPLTPQIQSVMAECSPQPFLLSESICASSLLSFIHILSPFSLSHFILLSCLEFVETTAQPLPEIILRPVRVKLRHRKRQCATNVLRTCGSDITIGEIN